MANYHLAVDSELQAAYLEVSPGASARTVEVDSDLLVDISADGQVIGIEFLTLRALKDFTPQEISAYTTSEIVQDLAKFINNQRLNPTVA